MLLWAHMLQYYIMLHGETTVVLLSFNILEFSGITPYDATATLLHETFYMAQQAK